MEKVKPWDKESLITELTQGKEFVNKLKNQFDSPEKCDLLLEKILSSLDKSLSILNWKVFNGTKEPFSSCSSISDLGSLRDLQGQNKKRNKMLQWSKQVRISGTGLESFNDGYSWRKYGQKDILRAIHPRAYYRCTHRHTQGCLATKQVQQSDEDPLLFQVTYKGNHSCRTSKSSIFISHENQNPNPNLNLNQCQHKKQKVEKLNTIKEEASSIIHPCDLTLFQTSCIAEALMHPVLPTLKCENQNSQFFAKSIEPFTSESMYLSLLPTQEGEFEMEKILLSSESDRIEFSSTPTSVIDSPFCADWDTSMDSQFDIHDPNLMIDISEYFT